MGWVGHGSTLYALGAGVLSAVISLIVGLSAAEFLFVSFAVAVLAAALLRIIPNRVYALAAIACLLGLGAVYAYWKYHSYEIDLDDVRIGLYPWDLDRSMAVGADIALAFDNPNDFDIWVRSDKRRTTVNRKVSESDQSPKTWKADRRSTFAVTDAPIEFDRPLRPAQVAGGLFDFVLCYGRAEDAMTKRLAVRGTYSAEFHNNGEIRAKYDVKQLARGDCD